MKKPSEMRVYFLIMNIYCKIILWVQILKKIIKKNIEKK